MKTTIAEFVLKSVTDAAQLAQRARVLAAMTQLAPQRRNELAEAVNMVCRTIAAHGGKGTVRFSLVQDNGQRVIEVSITDLPESAETAAAEGGAPGHRASRAESRTPEAAVLQRVGELVDHFESSGWPVAGAVIRLAQILPPAFSFPSEAECADWARILKSNTALDALAYALHRARTLERDLGHAQCQQQLHQALGSTLAESDHLAMLSLVIGKTKNAISILQPEGTIVGVNPAFEQMSGYSMKDAIGHARHNLLHGPSTDPAAVGAYRAALAAGTELTQDVLQYRKNGHTYWVESDLIPVRRGDGQVLQWIVIDTDITRRRETEEALRKAKETAEKSNQLKSEFLANMSHEIRTPLNAIIGMTDLTLATQLNDEQQEYLQTIRNSSESLLLLLNDILDLSKIEAGKMELEEIDFDLREVVHEPVRMLAVRARQKGLMLSSHLAENLPRSVRGDPTRLRQVLMNLIGNAIKFTAEGEVTVTVEQMWSNEEEIGLHFAVRDTGVGIPADKRDEIFQPFRQGDASTTRRYGGSGLGLTITSEMVRLMHGRIWVDSTPGRGSIFHFTIELRHGAPLALPPVAADDTAAPRDPIPAASWKTAPRVRSLRVLIADDHPANRQLVTSVLKRRGHACTEVTNGHEAVQAYRTQPYDVLLMDVQMPVLDGYQATAQIRNLEQQTRRHLPIIALTAHAMTGDREKCLAAGMDAYLAKPLRPQQLVALVESVAQLKPPAAPPAPQADNPDTPPAFDLDYALQTLDNDQELLAGQMEYFRQDAPALVDAAEQAIRQQDAHQLRLSAHRLKGLLARYAYHAAAELAAQLEGQAETGDFAAAAQSLMPLQPMVRQLTAAITEHLDRQRP